MSTKSLVVYLWSEIQEVIMREFQVTVWPILSKMILIMVPSILFCVYAFLNYDSMDMSSVKNYLTMKFVIIFLLSFSLCVVTPAICFRSIKIMLVGMCVFFCLVGYYCYLPWSNMQKYNAQIVSNIQFDSNNYMKVIPNGYLFDICRDDICSLKVIEVD